MVLVIAKRTAKADGREKYLALVEKMIEETCKEEGCVSYILCENKENPREFAIVEQWETQENLDAHMQSQHFKEIVPRMAELLEERKPAEVYTVVR